jgi:hypothetical protein
VTAAPADRDFLRALAALAGVLAALPTPGMVIGGLAAIARGVPRQTVDIDATVRAEGLPLGDLLAAFARHEIVPRVPDIEGFARRSQVLLLEHHPTKTPLEIALAWLPFEHEALARATEVEFGGVRIPVAQPEDLIVYKVVAWRDRDKNRRREAARPARPGDRTRSSSDPGTAVRRGA